MPIFCMYSFAICVIRASVIRGASLGEKESEICPTVFFSRGFRRVWSLKSSAMSLCIRRHDTLGLQYPGFLFHHVAYRPRKGRSRYYLTDHRANILRAAELPALPMQSVSPAVRCLWRVPAGSAGSGCRTILSAGRIPDGVPSLPAPSLTHRR